MSDDFVDRLLQLDVRELVIQISGVLRDPSSNVTMFVLFLSAVTILLLLIIIGLVLAFTRGDEELEFEEAGRESRTAASRPAAAEGGAAAQSRRRSVMTLLSSAFWLAVSIAVLMAAGYVSSRDAVCTSCHVEGSHGHTVRDADPAADPHSSVNCVNCHESSNWLNIVATAVPERAVHYAAGVLASAVPAGYGTPVSNRSCAGCHTSPLAITIENQERGLRMSHIEPLATSVLCTDCHTKQVGSGVIDRHIVGMEPCMRCHDQKIASAECSYCHTKDISYALRSRTFLEPQAQVIDITCGGCHSQEPCDACHGIRMPHTTLFKGLGHAREGVEDLWYNGGRGCSRCHTGERRPCTGCHTGPFPGHPISHMRRVHKTVDPYKNGCDGCHWQTAWIRGRNFCGVCHEQWSTLDPERTPRQ
jgi:hypothetical protein